MVDKLYELIGGNGTVLAAIDCFYRRVLEDDTLRPFFESTNMAHLQAGQKMFLSMLLGGRASYSGKTLAMAHGMPRRQGLTDKHFDAFVDHLRDALNEVGVEQEKANRVLLLLEDHRDSVVRG